MTVSAQPEQPEQPSQVCGRSYRAGSGRYYDCGRAAGHNGSHLPWPDRPAASPTPATAGQDDERDDMCEEVLSYIRSQTTLDHLVQYAEQRGYLAARPSADMDTLRALADEFERDAAAYRDVGPAGNLDPETAALIAEDAASRLRAALDEHP